MGATGATVATRQARDNTAYGDLTTVGPSVTVNTGNTVIVILTALIDGAGSAGNYGFMSFGVSGATTLAPTDTRSLRSQRYAYQVSATYLVTGLTAGSNTFTAKYRTVNNVNFENRSIIVIPVP